MKLTTTILLALGLSIQLGSGAIVMGNDNLDGSWTVGGLIAEPAYGTQSEVDPNTGMLVTEYFEVLKIFGPGSATLIFNGTDIFRNSSGFDGTLAHAASLGHYEFLYTSDNGMANGAQVGSDNFAVFDADNNGTADTVFQLDLDDPIGSQFFDTILNAWHDTGPDADIIAAAQARGGFANLSSPPVPEAHTVMLGLIGLLLFARRHRNL